MISNEELAKQLKENNWDCRGVFCIACSKKLAGKTGKIAVCLCGKTDIYAYGEKCRGKLRNTYESYLLSEKIKELLK